MSDRLLTSEQKSFKVVAVIKYHLDVGVFQAASKEDAYRIATESNEYWQIASHSRGGIYDLEIKEVP